MSQRYFFRYKKLVQLVFVAALSVVFSCCSPARQGSKKDVISIRRQGSFSVGGTVKKEAGNFNIDSALQPKGQTFHGDHAYVFYQVPDKAKQYPLVFLHGAGQSKQCWETTPDGRDGFQNIFLKKGYSVYLLDQPRRGEAGRSMAKATIEPAGDEQFWFSQFRLGNYPAYFSNVQFPKDSVSLIQFFRHFTPNTGSFDAGVVSDAVAAAFDTIGSGILITHSQGCGAGWLTAMKSPNVKAIAAYEPFSGYVFPEGELPEPIKSASLFGNLKGVAVPLADFKKLTQIPIVVYYGDNIAAEPTGIWNKDHWRAALTMARLWAAKINAYGGHATVVHLPEAGIYGNTHFMFSDLNNLQVADLLSGWLQQNKLN